MKNTKNRADKAPVARRKPQRLWAKILAGIAGVLLVAAALGVLADVVFQAPISGAVQVLLSSRAPLAILISVAIAVFLGALGVGCIVSLIPGRNARRGFVMQKAEHGAIGVSIRSIEGLVKTCVRQYSEVLRADVRVVEKRDGIAVNLELEETAGVNIPLIIGSLQKQIKQYVSDCTGVDVCEVRVLVENAEEAPAAEAAPMETAAALEPAALVAAVAVQTVETPAAEECIAQETAETVACPTSGAPCKEECNHCGGMEQVEAASGDGTEEAGRQEDAQAAEVPPVTANVVVAPAPMPTLPEAAPIPETVDDRPLHQRLFGTEEQPVTVPVPPLVIEEDAPAENGVQEEPEGGIPVQEIGMQEEIEMMNLLEKNAGLLEAVDGIDLDETDREVSELLANIDVIEAEESQKAAEQEAWLNIKGKTEALIETVKESFGEEERTPEEAEQEGNSMLEGVLEKLDAYEVIGDEVVEEVFEDSFEDEEDQEES